MRGMRAMVVATFIMMLAGVGYTGEGAAAGEPGSTGRVKDRSRICMMQDSLQPKVGLKHEYAGKTYWLCCQMCVQAFEADPERYAHATDPVNGQQVDKATAPAYAVNGKAFFFSSEKTLETFAKNPTRYLQGG
jgi:YHS domain-containing protein